MIPIITVIEGLTKAIELANRSIGFFSQFETRRRRLFLSQIEPTFESLRPVLRSYGDDIAAFRADIADSLDYVAAEHAIMELAEKRRKTVRERAELVSALDATLHYWYEKTAGKSISHPLVAYTLFMRSITNYFAGYDTLRASTGTLTTTLSQVAVDIVRDRKPLSEPEQTQSWPIAQVELLVQCAAAITILEERHVGLFRKYAELRLACLGEGQLVQKS
jgi:hypothetical protein